MGTLRISDADLARDPYAVLAKGEGRRRVDRQRETARWRRSNSSKRSVCPISECIAAARACGSKAILDGGFGKDVEKGIRAPRNIWISIRNSAPSCAKRHHRLRTRRAPLLKEKRAGGCSGRQNSPQSLGLNSAFASAPIGMRASMVPRHMMQGTGQVRPFWKNGLSRAEMPEMLKITSRRQAL